MAANHYVTINILETLLTQLNRDVHWKWAYK